MSKDANHGPLWVVGLKSIAFTLVTVLATGMLAMTIRNSTPDDQHTYTALFTDVTSLNRGDDVRMAGVKVGSVSDIEIADARLAKVTFTVSSNVAIEDGARIVIKFRNLVGQRMLSIDQPDLSGPGAAAGKGGAAGVRPAATGSSGQRKVLRAGHAFGLEETRPALDLTVLFNGFRPLMRMLSPKDVNNLSEQIVAVFQGEGGTVDGLLSSTASLTSALAEKDQVIGELITSLSSVLSTVDQRSDQLDTTLVTMQQLVSGLAEDRAAIGGSIAGMGELTTRVASMLTETRTPLRKSIDHLGEVSTTLEANSPQLENFLKMLPIKLDAIGRTASYGSWVNMYLCSMDGRIPAAEGYMGSIGAQPVAARCK